MDPLDQPAKLVYNNGNNFPPNFVVIAYVLLVVSVFLLITGSYIFGGILLILTLFAITNRHYVVINDDENLIHEYNQYFALIKAGKKFPLDRYKYITIMPLIESQNIHARTGNSTTISNSYATVTLFGERLRGKRVITKCDSKADAFDIAKKLGERLGLTYFEYDPQLIRQVLRGQKTI